MMIKVFQKFNAVEAIFTQKEGGFSGGKFASLNLGFHVGDDALLVKKNHLKVKSYFENAEDIVYMDQVHSNVVCDTGKLTGLTSCDALITNKINEILMVMVADCIPILFYDQMHHVISSIHAGRAGAFENIVQQSFTMMQNSYKTKAKDLHVAIGPHIHACCYEIGEDLAELAKSKGYEFALIKRDNSYYLDLYAIVLKQLENLGVKAKNIEYIDVCTACNTKSYFSYRKEGQTGRFCGAIMLK
jgi:polyphenol oxidase